MDLNNIFDIFNQSNNQKTDDVNLLVDFSEHPLYWIGGFHKIISNHLFFKKYLVKIFKNTPDNSNLENLELAGEYLMFDKAWNYIKNFDINNQFHIECLKTKSDTTLLDSLEITLRFFEGTEEFEKCILLKEIQDKVKDFIS